MTHWGWGLAAVRALGALTAAAFLGLGLISPRAPSLIEVPGVEISHEGIRFEDRGTGEEAAVLLHGFNNQLAVWNPAWAEIQRCGRALRVDLPGFGGSKLPRGRRSETSLSAQSDRLLALLDERGIRQARLVGVSMGGSLAAWFAAHHAERVRSLALLAPSGYPGSLHFGGRFGTLLSLPAKNWIRRLALAASETWLFDAGFPQAVTAQALGVTASYGDAWAAALPRIQARTHVVWSTGDAGVPYRFASLVAGAIPGSKLLTLPDSVGHDIPVTRPSLVARLACLTHNQNLDAALL